MAVQNCVYNVQRWKCWRISEKAETLDLYGPVLETFLFYFNRTVFLPTHQSCHVLFFFLIHEVQLLSAEWDEWIEAGYVLPSQVVNDGGGSSRLHAAHSNKCDVCNTFSAANPVVLLKHHCTYLWDLILLLSCFYGKAWQLFLICSLFLRAPSSHTSHSWKKWSMSKETVCYYWKSPGAVFFKIFYFAIKMGNSPPNQKKVRAPVLETRKLTHCGSW